MLTHPGEPSWAGTFFFVEHEGFAYAVTAAHVYDGVRRNTQDGLLHLKLNLRNGGSTWASTRLPDWVTHPSDDGVDVAACPIQTDWRLIDHKWFPMSGALSPATMHDRGVGIGDEVFLTGLFTLRPGKKRNIPILRTGAIAAMADDEPIEWTRKTIEANRRVSMAAYLVEARSIGGLSGSPVFLHMGAACQYGNSVSIMGGGPEFYLLGLMHGHWDAPPDASEMSPEVAASDSEEIRAEKVNMGIGIVVPAESIQAVLDHPELKVHRDRASDAERHATDPRQDDLGYA